MFRGMQVASPLQASTRRAAAGASEAQHTITGTDDR